MIPVVLCGGSGTRLWPVSRANHPKQFVDFLGNTLFEATVSRLSPLGEPWVIAVREFEAITRSYAGKLGISEDHLIFEPQGRNTAAAIGLLCRVLELRDLSDEVVGVFPADHMITNQSAFLNAVREAEQTAKMGQVCTLGIQPSSPATGFGYIELEEKPTSAGKLAALRAIGFREKPDLKTAESFVNSGRFVWNAGIFVFRVKTMISHFERLMPELWASMRKLRPDLSNLKEIYSSLPSISIDYGIMEKLQDQMCVPCDPGWSDLGSWDDIIRFALNEQVEGLGAKVQNRAQAFSVDSNSCFALTGREKVVGFVNVDDIVVVDTEDAILISRKGSTQDVRKVVAALMTAKRKEAVEHRFEIRPWGRFEILCDEPHYKAKRIMVHPGQRISYQSHAKRSEHWTIVAGLGEVVLNEEIIPVQSGTTVFIPVGAKHRIRNTGTAPLEFVEVQTGSYFGEDDITRFQDDYCRL